MGDWIRVRDADGNIRCLRWNPGGWAPGMYQFGHMAIRLGETMVRLGMIGSLVGSHLWELAPAKLDVPGAHL